MEENKEKETLNKKTIEIFFAEKSQINNSKNINNLEKTATKKETLIQKITDPVINDELEKINEVTPNKFNLDDLNNKKIPKVEGFQNQKICLIIFSSILDHLEAKLMSPKNFNFKIRPFSASHPKKDIPRIHTFYFFNKT